MARVVLAKPHTFGSPLWGVLESSDGSPFYRDPSRTESDEEAAKAIAAGEFRVWKLGPLSAPFELLILKCNEDFTYK
jgi:hypothetical protein